MIKRKIAFLGADGSGKTTLISYTKEKLENNGKDVGIFVMGWKNFQNPILKILSRLYLNYKKDKKDEKLARFRERSCAFYILYYLELWTRYLKVLRSKKDIILFDRYFYEELMFAKGLKFKFFKLLTPKPDLCFSLKAPVKVLKQRGVFIEERRLQDFYAHLNNLRKFFPILEVDSSKNAKQTFKKINQKIKGLF